MTYEYKSLTFKMTFRHGKVKHHRLDEMREATTLLIASPTGNINIEQTFFCRGDKPLPSLEFRRRAVIGKFKPHLSREEYVAMRRAYFSRSRKTTASRHQSKMCGKELRRLIGDGDVPETVRIAAAQVDEWRRRTGPGKTADPLQPIPLTVTTKRPEGE